MGYNAFSLRNKHGQRKYLNKIERTAFMKASMEFEKEKRLFFHMLFWTGARISEILNLTVNRIDFLDELVAIETLKKRSPGYTREIPLPNQFLQELASLINILIENRNEDSMKIWPWSRRSASRYIKAVMTEANIYGPQASALGLRHGFAVNCVLHDIPLTTLQKWMGHADISTTAIYTNVIGKEERIFAQRMWESCARIRN